MADVIPLAAFAERGREIGPKLRRLAALASWGYRVPDGFALTDSAARAVAAGGVSAPLPDAVVREYDALCERLGREPALAVRSAALAEDGDERSYAGMYDTVLGVRGRSRLAAAIRTCVASLRGARADSYGAVRAGAMSVGVQELIDARASGVVFSRHPVTHREDRLVIEAVLGLGSAMVDGLAQPDHVEVGRADGRVLRYDVGDKRQRAVPLATGGVALEDAPAAARRVPCLTAAEVDELRRAAIDIEARIGRAVDVEWVVAEDGGVAVVQARPITVGPREARPPVRWDPLAYASQFGARRGR